MQEIFELYFGFQVDWLDVYIPAVHSANNRVILRRMSYAYILYILSLLK